MTTGIKGAKVIGRFGEKLEPHRQKGEDHKLHVKDGKVGRLVDGKVTYDGSQSR